jgi:hypothetical protein
VERDEVLEPTHPSAVYGRFGEGFDTADLRDVKLLLDSSGHFA